MKLDRELITLRISVARIAQAAGICPASFGALTIEPHDGYRTLHAKALAHSRGWNRLALEVVDRLQTADATMKPIAIPRERSGNAIRTDDERGGS